jgi:putative ABC transport system permease protein
VKEVHTLLRTNHRYEGVMIDVEAIKISRQGQDRYRFKEGDPAAAWRAFQGGAVFVSEPLAYDHGIAVGDSVSLQTRRGRQSFAVAGVFYDYSSDVGTLLMSRQLYGRYWSRSGYTSLSVVAEEGVSSAALSAQLADRLAGQELQVRSNRELRNLSMQIFDQTFAVTRVLQLLTILVALVGVFSALMALQLERTREIGVLRAIGFTPGQIKRVMIGQTTVMGAMAGVLALPLGGVLAWVLVHVINKRSFGWTLQLTWSGEVLVQALAIALGAALLSGIYPAVRLSKMSVVKALREE